MQTTQLLVEFRNLEISGTLLYSQFTGTGTQTSDSVRQQNDTGYTVQQPDNYEMILKIQSDKLNTMQYKNATQNIKNNSQHQSHIGRQICYPSLIIPCSKEIKAGGFKSD